MAGIFVALSALAGCASTGRYPSAIKVGPIYDTEFAVDNRMQEHWDFWLSIYTQYTTQQGLIHDSKNLQVVYEVLSSKNRFGPSEKEIRASKERWRNILLSVHKKRNAPASMTPEETRVYALFSNSTEESRFIDAAHRKRLRFQLGQKDRFLTGYKYSGRYLSLMEDIFRREGLPTELTRLPFVESSFNIKAYSKVGASGIWQFMPSTGRQYLTINEAVDERNDPIRATEAAAKFLRQNFKSLKRWPLAVTAYNHGRKGVMIATMKSGSEELEEIVDVYRSRTFGFASGNFFVNLLAVIEAERFAEKYFGKVERDPAEDFVEIRVQKPVGYAAVVKALKLSSAELREHNPGINSATVRGQYKIPRGYRLRVPAKLKDVARDLVT